MNEEKCCITSCDLPLDQTYWNNQYEANTTGWDLGHVSPPIKVYLDSIEDKKARILIPGCGNAYEAEYLLQQGFKDITVIDIAPTLIETLKRKFFGNKHIKITLGDFFEHAGSYDYIIEQTFFCALPPKMRQRYVWKMHRLLSRHGKLAGLFFNREFEISPPFGGNLDEYKKLFQNAFVFNSLSLAKYSVPARQNSELFLELQKDDFNEVNLYQFQGITCKGCMNTVSGKFLELDGVASVSMNADFSEILIVGRTEIPLKILQEVVSYDEKYKILKYNDTQNRSREH